MSRAGAKLLRQARAIAKPKPEKLRLPRATVNAYTFEPVTESAEHTTWLLAFVDEHNAGASRERQAMARANVMSDPDVGKSTRILADGVLIGYACYGVSPIGIVVRDAYVLPEHRGVGHYHAVLPLLAAHVGAGAVELADYTYDKHRAFYESLGFVNVVYGNKRRDVLYVATHDAVKGLRPVHKIEEDFKAFR